MVSVKDKRGKQQTSWISIRREMFIQATSSRRSQLLKYLFILSLVHSYFINNERCFFVRAFIVAFDSQARFRKGLLLLKN